MINPIQLIESNARLLHDSGLISPSADYDRVLLDVYLTVLKCGLLTSDSLTYSELLERTPSKYYPCPLHMVDTYNLSTLTVQNRVKKCLDLLEFELSDSDIESIKELYGLLPLTTDQANTFLINKDVIDSRYSHDGICFLIKLATKKDVKKAPINIYDEVADNSSGEKERAKRNSKPSVFVICPDNIQPQKLKVHFLKVLRAVRAMTNQLGFVVLDLVCNSAPLVIKKRNVITVDLVKSVLSARTEYEYVSNGIVIASDIDKSEYVRLLALLLNKVGSVPTSFASTFFKSFYEYKLQASRVKSSDSSDRSNRKKIAFFDLVSGFDVNTIDERTIESVVELSNILSVSSDAISVNQEMKDSDILHNDSYWLSIYLDFISSTCTSNPTLDDLCNYYVDVARNSFEKAFKNPNGFFGVAGENLFVSDDHSLYANNRRGEFVQPDFDSVNDDIAFKLSKLDELKTLGQSNFSVYEEAFMAVWKPKKGSKAKKRSLMELYSDSEFVSDLRTWMVNSRPQSAINYLKTDNATCDYCISSLVKRLAYIKSQESLIQNSSDSEALDTTISNTEHKIELWNERKSINLEILNDVSQSELSVKMEAINAELEVLYALRKSLRIKTKEFESHLLIHDWIVQSGGTLAVERVYDMAESYLSVLCSKSVPANVPVYHALYNLFNYHPFGCYLSDLK